MAYSLVSVFMITVFCFSRRAVTVMAQSNCNFLESTSDKCRSADFIIVQDQRVDKQKEGQPEAETSKRIRLAQIYKQKWGGFMDQQKSVRRGANQQTSYGCSTEAMEPSNWAFTNALTSPDLRKRARNVLCQKPPNSVEFDGADSSACVFELKKSTSNVNSKTTTISVDGKIRAEVE